VTKIDIKVWNDFVKFEGPKGNEIAQRKHCRKEFVGASGKGTSHLKNHLEKCNGKGGEDIGQQMLSISKSFLETAAIVKNHKFVQLESRMDFAKMVIVHNYPFNMVEHEYFEIFCNGLQPMFKLVSQNTVRSNVFEVYKSENEKFHNHLEKLPGRITLTTNLWTSDHQDIGYICLTSHFIDEDWESNKK